MGCSFSSNKKESSVALNWIGAGILFNDGKVALGGIKNGSSIISGIGGKKENDENYLECAIRETIEEIFEINCTKEFISKFIYNSGLFIYDKMFINNDYVVIVCDISVLQNLAIELVKEGYTSRLYNNGFIFDSIEGLISERKRVNGVELKSLVLVPISYKLLENVNISECFLSDLHFLRTF